MTQVIENQTYKFVNGKSRVKVFDPEVCNKIKGGASSKIGLATLVEDCWYVRVPGYNFFTFGEEMLPNAQFEPCPYF